jgi:hypothetical protein
VVLYFQDQSGNKDYKAPKIEGAEFKRFSYVFDTEVDITGEFYIYERSDDLHYVYIFLISKPHPEE